jgi:nicotinamidase-related amidase
MKNSSGNFTRRQFLKVNTVGGIGAALSFGAVLPVDGSSAPLSLHVRPRYHRWHVDRGVEWLEANTGYAHLDWSIPLSQTALVLVDVWQRHYLKDTEERGEQIIQDKLIPLVDTCRKYNMSIIHAPSPSVAKRHPNWVNLVDESETVQKRDEWPPQEFRNLSGPYKKYQRPFEPREEERQQLPELTFHPHIQPLNKEAVVATGEELHRLCKKEGILFLFFAGFNTNACIISRDYGTIQMSNRGYQVTLVRDCTTGMESAATHDTLAQTNGAVLLLEMFGQYSVASDEIIKSLSSHVNKG